MTLQLKQMILVINRAMDFKMNNLQNLENQDCHDKAKEMYT